MRILVSLIIDTIPMLGNVMLLSTLIFLVFGIVGVQLWKGLLRNRCFSSLLLNDTVMLNFSTPFYQPEDTDFICSINTGLTTCDDVPQSLNSSQFTICKASELNPFKDSISFDNIGYALITIFQVNNIMIL